MRRVVGEIEASRAPTALLSSEHFSLHFDRAEARGLADDFQRYQPLVVLVLRPVHERFVSSYNNHVTVGGCLTIEQYARSVLAPGTRYMHAREAIAIWQEGFGAERIRLVDYASEPDITSAILRLAGLTGAPSTAGRRRRLSLDTEALAILRLANAELRSRQRMPAESHAAAWVQLYLACFLCRRGLRPTPAGHRPTTVSARTLAQLDEITAIDAAWIARHYGFTPTASRRADLIVAGAEQPDSEADVAAARALVDRSTRGLIRPSNWLVGALARLGGGSR